MNRFILIFMACLIAWSNSANAAQPSTQPTTTISTQPALKPIELHYSIYLARLDHRITISPDGTLRSVRVNNKSYGPNDIDPKHERVEIREGKLTPEQMAGLSRLFADWDSLSSKPYGGVPDGPAISIRYGDRTMSSGSAVPKQVLDAQARLQELAQAMPIVDP